MCKMLHPKPSACEWKKKMRGTVIAARQFRQQLYLKRKFSSLKAVREAIDLIFEKVLIKK